MAAPPRLERFSVVELRTRVKGHTAEVIRYLGEQGVPVYQVLDACIDDYVKGLEGKLPDEVVELLEARRVGQVEGRIKRLRYVAHARQRGRDSARVLTEGGRDGAEQDRWMNGSLRNKVVELERSLLEASVE